MEDYPRTQLEFERRFATEEACRAFLAKVRWPDGYVCRTCSSGAVWLTGRGRFRCLSCRAETSVTAGTVFQDTHLSLLLWFRAMWCVTSQKTGASAQHIQRMLGLGSYKTAWALMHKLRYAMVRPGRDRLRGTVEADETYYGGEETGVDGRQTLRKAIVAVAVEVDGRKIGRIRLKQIPRADRATIHAFLRETIEPGSTLLTDGHASYKGLPGYLHQPTAQLRQPAGTFVLPRAHRVISLLKRWLLGTHQGAVERSYLDYYLDEFTFRFNRRTSRSRGKLFYRLIQHAIAMEPLTFDMLTQPQPVDDGGVK
jgi:transposase-like protein